MSRLRPLRSFPALLSVVVLTLLLAACGGSTGASAGDAGTQKTESQPLEQAEDRPEAPDIAGKTLTGEDVSLADFRGKPVFVKVWASW